MRVVVFDARRSSACASLELRRGELAAEVESADLGAPQRIGVLLQSGVAEPPDSRRADGIDLVHGRA